MKKEKEKKKIEVVFILDKSGSMQGNIDHTISSFNEYLEKEKKNKFDTIVSTILFNDQVEVLHHKKPIQDIPLLTKKDYVVGGCTALYDALGNAICKMSEENQEKVLFIIITDGYENASKEYNKSMIQGMIASHKKWEFIYIGADIDSYATGGDLGIRQDHIANFKKDKKGTSLLFQSVGHLEACMMEDREIDGCWKKNLEDYLEQNQK